MKKLSYLAVVCMMAAAAARADSFGTFDIDFVTISGSTNPGSGYGIVNNDYRMGTYEITNDQWTKFKAAYGTVAGTPTSAYDSAPYWPGSSVPTNRVSWYEAAQFVNFLNTSTGHTPAYKFTGDIHTSNYTLAVWGAGDADGTNLYRNKNAKYFLPTENEWVKAAYWNGTNLQTYSNASAGDLVSGSPDPSKWNYYPSAGSSPWNVGSGIHELNGTYDMMGNVWEWMESPYYSGDYLSGSTRGVRGGSYFLGTDSYLASSNRNGNSLYDEDYTIGFRVASVPEPASAMLMILGAAWIAAKRKR